MNTSVKVVGALFGVALLAGCSYKGTTYGTGVSHEKQTADALMNMLSIKPPEKENIDYSARPELVMPSNMAALPEPGQTAETVGEENWPVGPEERIAAARAAAPEADDYGNVPTEFLTSEKQGIRNSADFKNSDLHKRSRRSGRAGGGEQLIEAVRSDANGNEEAEKVKKLREQLAYSSGPQRKFLVEPPAEYRVPADSAEAGDLGITVEQLTERERRLKKDQEAIERGTILPTGAQ